MTTTKLPPDPEHMNDDRAKRAAVALRRFQSATGTDDLDALADLLCDLMHWADRNGLRFDDELSRARVHYEAETSHCIEILVDALNTIAAGNTEPDRMVQIAIDALEACPNARAKLDLDGIPF